MESKKKNEPASPASEHLARDYPHGAVVAVVLREERFLTIKRSRFVKAPGKVCFCGGGVEPGEAQDDAIVREMKEELGVDVVPIAHVFVGTTPSGVELNFWQVEISEGQDITPNPQEVVSFTWHSANEMRQHPDLLTSAIEFLDAWETNDISLRV